MKMLSSSSSNIPLFVSVFIISCTTEALVKLPRSETVPALIVFGDSIVDPGNNNNLVTPANCNFPPCGRDFIGGIPTGRFSNGIIRSDFIAEELGIKKSLPAYLDPTLQPSDLLTGVSFASGASGCDPLTSKILVEVYFQSSCYELYDFTPTSSMSDGSGRRMKEVACPICTVHLQVQVPSSGSETIECGVCQHPFLVSAH